jgi:transcriptional regulator with XRE-family HTH domain
LFSYEKYAKLRDEHKVTDYEVAKRTKVQTSTLSNWKAGRYTPKSNKIKAIADYFGVSIEYFLEQNTGLDVQ